MFGSNQPIGNWFFSRFLYASESVTFDTVILCNNTGSNIFPFPNDSCGVLPVSVKLVTFWSHSVTVRAYFFGLT